MKIAELVDLLSNSEIEHLEFVINSTKRRSLINLHNYFIHNSKKPFSREDVFKTVFNKKYTESDDYLLRNEQRIYVDKIRLVMAVSSLNSDDILIHYLGSLHKRQNVDLFEKETRRAEKLWKSSQKFNLLSELYDLKFQNSYAFKFKVDQDSIDNLNSILASNYASNYQSFSTIQKELEVANAFLSLNAVKLGLHKLPKLKTKKEHLENNPLLQYLEAKEKTFSLSMQNRTEILESALNLLEKVNPKSINTDKERIVLLNNLALEHYFNRQYESAITVFESLLETMNQSRQSVSFPLYYNYVSALLKSSNYSDAHSIITKNKELFENAGSMQLKAVSLYAMSCIFNHQFKEAKQLIPARIHEGSDDDYLYLRLTLSIIYYSQDKIDLCERENTNLLQVSSSGERFETYMFCAKSFNRLLRFKNKDQLEKLSGAVNQYICDTTNRHGDILPLLWLNRTISIKLAAIR